jgi:hypothetical protein
MSTEADLSVTYKVKNDIEISHSVLKHLLKFCESSVKHHVEGILYGHEDESKVYIEQAIPMTKREDGTLFSSENELIVRIGYNP